MAGISLSLKDGNEEMIRNRAKAEGRTFSGMIQIILTEHVDREEINEVVKGNDPPARKKVTVKRKKNSIPVKN